MSRLIVFTAALLVAGQASAYAQGERSKHHRHLMSAQAQWQGQEPQYIHPYRGYPGVFAPSYGGGYGYSGYGYGSDDYAIGRTNGSP